MLPLGGMEASEADAQLYRRIGILGPWTQPLIGEVMADGAAAREGLQAGDVVERIGATRIVDGQQLREAIRASVRGNQPLEQIWTVRRNGAFNSFHFRM